MRSGMFIVLGRTKRNAAFRGIVRFVPGPPSRGPARLKTQLLIAFQQSSNHNNKRNRKKGSDRFLSALCRTGFSPREDPGENYWASNQLKLIAYVVSSSSSDGGEG